MFYHSIKRLLVLRNQKLLRKTPIKTLSSLTTLRFILVLTVRNMKTSLFLAVFIILGFGRKAKADESFECPKSCSENLYKPVCVRGKSYVNLCILKRDICNGRTPREFYKDVEACPRYDKDDEANGASVEMIDKNGVIFRRLIDDRDQIEDPKKSLNHSAKPIVRTTGKPVISHGDRRRKKHKRKPICPESCSNPRHPNCANRNLCADKFRNRRCWDLLNKIIISF